MSISTTILELRLSTNLSQERFAQIMNVSKMEVENWECGSSLPDMENTIKIAKFFNISLDALILSSDKTVAGGLSYDKKIQPEYSSIPVWESYSSEIWAEYRQSVDEGKDIQSYEQLFKEVSKMPKGAQKEKISDVLFDIVLNAPQAQGYHYIEPSDLEGIRLLRPEFQYQPRKDLEQSALKNKIHGAWLGRICGCLLGKPIECIRTNELYPILKESNNYPMHRYINSTDITDEMREKCTFQFREGCYADTISFAPTDDDTNYVVLASVLIEKYGRDFTPLDVSKVWMDYQKKEAYCTAERVAFRNFVNGFVPPHSAMYKNPYREWIGAQIRGDYFGYINPGNPELAAEMAWRDASISHIKNGIYGEMFVAAMLAVAAVNDSVEEIIEGGLAQIPSTSRLYEAVTKLLEQYRRGVSEEDCFLTIHKTYNEHEEYDWCHTISNALIVAAVLLYGKGEYGESICMAVQTGFDTDCNGATVGSILGMKNGVEGIGAEWCNPVRGELDTTVFGIGKVKISDMAEATMKHINK